MLIGLVCLMSLLGAGAVCAFSGAFAGFGWLWVLPVSFLGFFVLLGVLAFLFLYLLCKSVNLDIPQERDNGFVRQVMYIYEEAIFSICRVRLEKRGFEQLPQGGGPILLACNHLNDLDPLVLHQCFRSSRLAFISKRENRDMFIIGKLMHRTMCQMINRENDREALKTILKCIQIAKDGIASIAVFPEGYTSLDGKLHPFRGGVFKIAQKAQIPIVVVTVQNTKKILPNAQHLRPTHVPVHLVGVLEPQELTGRTAIDIAGQVYEMMISDLGEDFRYQESQG